MHFVALQDRILELLPAQTMPTFHAVMEAAEPTPMIVHHNLDVLPNICCVLMRHALLGTPHVRIEVLPLVISVYSSDVMISLA
jgi:hypothetical protein